MKPLFNYFFDFMGNSRHFSIAWFIAPITHFINAYIFDDWAFLLNLVVIITVDTILGVICGLKKKNFSSEAFSKLFHKIIIYSLVLVATHTAANLKINGEVSVLLSWTDSLIYSTMIVRELISIFEKTAILGYFKIPTWILQKLKDFDDTGNLKKNGNHDR